MSSIQGISAAASPAPAQLQKPVAPPVRRDNDGDVDKAGTADRDKGNKIDVKG
jgi:hypothetical protein